MRVLAVQNFPGASLGQVGLALSEAGAQVDLVLAFEGEALPHEPEGYDGLVVLGGAQNACADAESPWLPDLCRLMRAFGDSGRSVLGICLGSQLLVRAYGGENIIGGAEEFGWQQVALTKEGRGDPLFSDAPEAFPIFQWHDDTFTLPEGAVRLASSAMVANQAFRIGRAAYGIQFHFEADRTMVEEWSRDNAATVARRWPAWPEIYPALAANFGARADAVGLEIARSWVRTLVSAAVA